MIYNVKDINTIIAECQVAILEAYQNEPEYLGKFLGGIDIGPVFPLTTTDTRYSAQWEVDYFKPRDNHNEEPSLYDCMVTITLADWQYTDSISLLPDHESNLEDLLSIYSYLRHPQYWQQTANQLYAIDITTGTPQEIENKKLIKVNNQYVFSKIDYNMYSIPAKNNVRGYQINLILELLIDK
jgi:hypothetical protein